MDYENSIEKWVIYALIKAVVYHPKANKKTFDYSILASANDRFKLIKR